MRDLFEIEKGLRISDENSDSSVSILQGSSVPDGLGDLSSAEIGSLYLRRGTGEIYQKKTNAGDANDWVLQGGASIGTWRPEKIRVLSGDTGIVPGVARDLTASPFSDDEGSQLSAADFTVGEYAIIDDVLLEVTAVASPNVTFSTPGVAALAEGDTFVAINYLPDSPY